VSDAGRLEGGGFARMTFLLVLGPGLPDALSAQRPAVAADFLGVTRCDGDTAVSQVRPDLTDSALVAQVEAHERVHRMQAGEYPSCRAFLASLQSARRIIDVELPAYCAQWRVAVAQGADPADTRREYAWRLAAQSGAMENRLDVLGRFERECS
jgi:hypothetical protein